MRAKLQGKVLYVTCDERCYKIVNSLQSKWNISVVTTKRQTLVFSSSLELRKEMLSQANYHRAKIVCCCTLAVQITSLEYGAALLSITSAC